MGTFYVCSVCVFRTFIVLLFVPTAFFSEQGAYEVSVVILQ